MICLPEFLSIFVVPKERQLLLTPIQVFEIVVADQRQLSNVLVVSLAAVHLDPHPLQIVLDIELFDLSF